LLLPVRLGGTGWFPEKRVKASPAAREMRKITRGATQLTVNPESTTKTTRETIPESIRKNISTEKDRGQRAGAGAGR